MRGIWGHRSDFSTKTLGVQCVIKKKKSRLPTEGRGGADSLSLSSLFSYLSLSSLTDILTWLTISSHAYIYVSRYTYII